MTAVSFPRALLESATRDPRSVAVVCRDKTITRIDLDRASNRMARAYESLGVGFGDFVSIALPNGIEWFVACMAAWKLGAVPNPISPALPPPEREAVLERAQPRLVVGFARGEVGGRVAVPAGYIPDADVADAVLPDRVSPVERALASGGSTGVPKLICVKSPAMFDPVSQFAMFTARRCVLIPGPLYHGVPYASAWRSLFADAMVVVMPRFDASTALELIERHRVDRVSFVPTMMQRIARLPEEERRSRDLSSLEFVVTSGAPCPQWLMRFWIEWLGPEVMHDSFGSTERIGGAVISGTEWLRHPGSVGKPAGGTQIRILDPDSGEECPPGVMGEIYMMAPTGPGSSYEYIGAESQLTADGWESIGDMGYLDEEGYLYLGDRRADMILSRGRNVFPAEVEAALDAHPQVRSSAVIGLPDDDLGQSIHAIVEADGVTTQELEAHVREHLVHYKVPATYEFVGEPLRNAAGKVRRSALRDARIAARVGSPTPEQGGSE